MRLGEIADKAGAAVERGSALIILTDRLLSAERAPVPSLLAQAAVHHALVNRGLRMRASMVVEPAMRAMRTNSAVLFGYGAAAACPSLGYETIAFLRRADPTGCDVAVTRYRLALERGLRTLMSKMGVCTFSGYCGAQLFEILGLDASLVGRFFPGTASPVGGATLADIAATVLARHRGRSRPRRRPPNTPACTGSAATANTMRPTRSSCAGCRKRATKRSAMLRWSRPSRW